MLGPSGAFVMNSEEAAAGLYREAKLQVAGRGGRPQCRGRWGTRSGPCSYTRIAANARWGARLLSTDNLYRWAGASGCWPWSTITRGMPGAGRRHLVVRLARRSGTGRHHLLAWPAGHDRFRQTPGHRADLRWRSPCYGASKTVCRIGHYIRRPGEPRPKTPIVESFNGAQFRVTNASKRDTLFSTLSEARRPSPHVRRTTIPFHNTHNCLMCS